MVSPSDRSYEGNITRINSYMGVGENGHCPVTRIFVSVAVGKSHLPSEFDVRAQSFPVLTILKPTDKIKVTFGADGKPSAIEWMT